MGEAQLGFDLVSILLAFLGGMVSFLSPCVFPIVPVYLSLISGLSFEQMQDAEAEQAVADDGA